MKLNGAVVRRNRLPSRSPDRSLQDPNPPRAPHAANICPNEAEVNRHTVEMGRGQTHRTPMVAAFAGAGET